MTKEELQDVYKFLSGDFDFLADVNMARRRQLTGTRCLQSGLCLWNEEPTEAGQLVVDVCNAMMEQKQ